MSESSKDNVSELEWQRMLVMPTTALVVGAAIGMVRGGRATSLRFLAENAHRPPRTVRGWYFYNKTKNYRVMLGAMKGAAKESVKLVGVSLGWVGIEESLERLGGHWREGKEIGAGVGTAALFSAAYKLRWKTSQQTILLGLGIGAIVKILKVGKERVMLHRKDINIKTK